MIGLFVFILGFCYDNNIGVIKLIACWMLKWATSKVYCTMICSILKTQIPESLHASGTCAWPRGKGSRLVHARAWTLSLL